jgi:phage repressor protein C with HTH and peptisase S24 domain
MGAAMARAAPPVKPDAVRLFLSAEIEKRGLDMASLSREIGMSHAYIQQFLKRGVPRELPERIRARLAEVLDVDEVSLGKRTLSKQTSSQVTKLSQIRNVGEYNALVSAGGGIVLSDEEQTGTWPLPRTYLEDMHLSGDGLAVVPVKGDSMEPTLRSGDRVLIDMGDKNVSHGGLFVLWDGTGRVLKRVERVPGERPPRLSLISDNPLHGKYQVAAAEVEIIGRVVWAARRL